MAKLTIEEELDAAIRTAAKEADPRATSHQVAEQFYDAHPELIEHFARVWIIDALARQVAQQRAGKRRARRARRCTAIVGDQDIATPSDPGVDNVSFAV